MERKASVAVIYFLTAATCSLFAIARHSEGGSIEGTLVWLCIAGVPLFFVLAYPRYLLQVEVPRNRTIYEGLFHLVCVVTSTALFVTYSQFWKNPLRSPGESIIFFICPLAILVTFLVAAVSLLIRRKSQLARPAAALFWPYWFVLALGTAGYFYQETGIYAVTDFLLFVTPVFLAFAAGALRFRPRLAHAFALLSSLAIPSMYWSLRDSGLGNVWLLFNQPKDRFASYPLYALVGILFVALLTFSIVTALLSLVPSFWTSEKYLGRAPIWIAFAASLIVMAIWYSQSVMPYRIPGAVDYSSWPIMQILHVQKRGLQFHESRVSIGGYRFSNGSYTIQSLRFSGNDRRLLQYQFAERNSNAQLTDSLTQRIEGILASRSQTHANDWDKAKPIRTWDADNWYVIIEGSGLKVYTKETKDVVPSDIVDLFNDLQNVPRSGSTVSQTRDVCLGFCYDPLAEMGYLYANHRCSNSEHGVVCH